MNRSILFSVLSASALTALSAAQEVEVQFFCDDIVRIVKIPEGGKKPRPSFVVTAKPESVDVSRFIRMQGRRYAGRQGEAHVRRWLPRSGESCICGRKGAYAP